MNDEPTPQHNYSRRKTEDLPADQLTHHRLRSLEQSVDKLTVAIAANQTLLSSIASRQEVGQERFAHYDLRLTSLEGDRRWTVMGIISAFGAMILSALAFFTRGEPPKLPVLLIAVLVLGGCAKDRAQIGADARAGVQAATMAVEAGETMKAAAILDAVDQRLPATAGVNSAEWPAPKMTAEQVFADPAAYGKSAPPEPSQAGFLAACVAGALAVLALARQVAPMVPVLGPVWSGVINTAYELAQHASAKKADKAAEHAKQVLDTAGPILALVRTTMPDLCGKLPESAQRALDAVIDSKAPPGV